MKNPEEKELQEDKKNKKLLSSVTKRVTGYGAFAAIFVTIFSYFASQVIAAISLVFWALLSGRDAYKVLNELESSTSLQFIFFVIVEVVTLYIIWAFLKSRNNSWKDIGMSRRPSLKDISPALLTFIIYFAFLLFITVIVSALIPSIDTEQKQVIGFENADTALKLIVVFISLVILPPVVEEIVVRGFLYTGLSKTFKIRLAAIITSVVFAIAHLQLGSGNPPLWIAAIDTFVLSMFLIYLREKTGALWSGMLVHAIKNGLAFLFIFVIKIPGI